MMKIDRSNYEIWVIDWLDGKLDELQSGRLLQFFAENPELKEEAEELSALKIARTEKIYNKKNDLRKTPSDLTESQFGILCAAHLESDLTREQTSELNAAVDSDPEKLRSLELFMKMKLMPPAVIYKGKKKLMKITLRQKVIRLSLIGLSAAAMVTFAVLSFVSRQQLTINGPEKKTEAAVHEQRAITEPSTSGKTRETSSGEPKISGPVKKVNHGKPVLIQNVNEKALAERQPVTIEKILISTEVELASEIPMNTLIASNLRTVKNLPEDISQDDGRTKVGKLFAKTFREKILREDVPEDTPLKAFEIAEAGVSGISKLLGWQMELDEKTDNSGKPKSFYFSSRMIKINAPVKKNENVR